MRRVCVSLGDPLQARREVGCLADDPPPLRLTRSNQVADDHEPSGDADTGLQGAGAFNTLTAATCSSPGRTDSARTPPGAQASTDSSQSTPKWPRRDDQAR